MPEQSSHLKRFREDIMTMVNTLYTTLLLEGLESFLDFSRIIKVFLVDESIQLCFLETCLHLAEHHLYGLIVVLIWHIEDGVQVQQNGPNEIGNLH